MPERGTYRSSHIIHKTVPDLCGSLCITEKLSVFRLNRAFGDQEGRIEYPAPNSQPGIFPALLHKWFVYRSFFL
jgi:hypothetical protein